MIKRSINPMFNDAVLERIKVTTIRENPWPVGKDIMLYNWKGKAYRSKQTNIAAVRVIYTVEISITNLGVMHYSPHLIASTPIHQVEGFENQAQMDQWFEKIVKQGETRTFHLMRFDLSPVDLQPITFQDHALN